MIDEEDITVGRTLYFIKNGNNSKHFVGVISEIFFDKEGIDGPLVKITYPLDPPNFETKTLGFLKSLIDDKNVVIR